jgi:hypothetical protein
MLSGNKPGQPWVKARDTLGILACNSLMQVYLCKYLLLCWRKSDLFVFGIVSINEEERIYAIRSPCSLTINFSV